MILFGYLGEILCIFKYNKSKIKKDYLNYEKDSRL